MAIQSLPNLPTFHPMFVELNPSTPPYAEGGGGASDPFGGGSFDIGGGFPIFGGGGYPGSGGGTPTLNPNDNGGGFVISGGGGGSGGGSGVKVTPVGAGVGPFGGLLSSVLGIPAINWGRIAAFLLGLILIAGGIYLIKPVQNVVNQTIKKGAKAAMIP